MILMLSSACIANIFQSSTSLSYKFWCKSTIKIKSPSLHRQGFISLVLIVLSFLPFVARALPLDLDAVTNPALFPLAHLFQRARNVAQASPPNKALSQEEVLAQVTKLRAEVAALRKADTPEVAYDDAKAYQCGLVPR